MFNDSRLSKSVKWTKVQAQIFFRGIFDDGDGTIFGFNLKLRWKFLAILLVFSLTPLIVVTIISQQKMTLP